MAWAILAAGQLCFAEAFWHKTLLRFAPVLVSTGKEGNAPELWPVSNQAHRAAVIGPIVVLLPLLGCSHPFGGALSGSALSLAIYCRIVYVTVKACERRIKQLSAKSVQ